MVEENYLALRDALKDITYKSGTRFVFLNDRFDAVRTGLIKVQMEYDNVDSFDMKTEVVLLRNVFYIKVSSHVCDLIRWVYDEVVRTELHEAAEFFKYKGKALFHPHVNL